MSVLVVLSVLLQEMIVKLRSSERIMSKYLIGFLIGYFRKTLHISKFGGFYKNEVISVKKSPPTIKKLSKKDEMRGN